MATVLVTGAGSGIGLALAVSCAGRGDHVYAGLRTLVNCPLELDHENIHILKLDVTSERDIDDALAVMPDLYGLPDVLVNNAGINMSGTVEESLPATWQEMFNVNFFAPITLSQKMLPHMREEGRGVIVMVSSLSAELGLPYDGPYAASKAALNRMSECLASEVRSFGIKILVVEPGATASNLNRTYQDHIKRLEAYDALHDHIQKTGARADQGEDPYVIAKEIMDLIDDPDAAFISPVGDQARAISQRLTNISPADRDQLIAEASGLSWWINQKSHNIKRTEND